MDFLSITPVSAFSKELMVVLLSLLNMPYPIVEKVEGAAEYIKLTEPGVRPLGRESTQSADKSRYLGQQG